MKSWENKDNNEQMKSLSYLELLKFNLIPKGEQIFL
jgi:hypothetical protein